MSNLGLLDSVWNGFVTYFGTSWLAFALLFIGILALIMVTVRVNAIIAVYLAVIPFFIVLLYNASLGNGYAVAGSVLIIGGLFGLAIHKWINK